MQVTRIIFSTITEKWYMQINHLQEVEIKEIAAQELIFYYKLVETNMFRWELI